MGVFIQQLPSLPPRLAPEVLMPLTSQSNSCVKFSSDNALMKRAWVPGQRAHESEDQVVSFGYHGTAGDFQGRCSGIKEQRPGGVSTGRMRLKNMETIDYSEKCGQATGTRKGEL
jgi:hypothetical protein